MRPGFVRPPHDELVHAVLLRPREAAALFRGFLPPDLAAALRLSRFRPGCGTVIDRELRRRESDFAFRARVAGSDEDALVLLEHQSEADRWMPLRSESYRLRTAEAWRRAHPSIKRPPLVLNVVLHTGPHPWKGPRSLAGLVAVPEMTRAGLAPWLGNPSFVLVDLAVLTESEIRDRAGCGTSCGSALLALTLLLLKHGQSRVLSSRLPAWADLFRAVWREPGGPDSLAPLVSYFLRTDREVDRAGLESFFEQHVHRRTKNMVMTYGDRLIAQGWKAGEAKGRAEGKAEGKAEGEAEGKAEALREALLEVIRARFGRPSVRVQSRIRRAPATTLRRWHARALKVESTSQIFAG